MRSMHLAEAEVAEGAEDKREEERRWVAAPITFEAIRRVFGPRFRRAIRMSESSIALLLGTLRPILPVGGLSAETRVLMNLRFFAGAKYLNLCLIHEVSITTL